MTRHLLLELKTFIIFYVNILIIHPAHIQLAYYTYIHIDGSAESQKITKEESKKTLGEVATGMTIDFSNNFAFYVQNIDPPELTAAATQLQSPIGNFTHLNNVYVNSSSNTVQITFMDTEKSIHEHAIYTWMETISDCQINFIPRLDMAIKVYYSDVRKLPSNDKEYNKFCYRLNYMYFFSGCFPTQFETSKLKQTPPDAGSFSRPVTFSFNNMVVLHNETNAKKYNLEHLWKDHKWKEITEYGKKKHELAQLKKELGSLESTSPMFRGMLEQRIYELEAELGDS